MSGVAPRITFFCGSLEPGRDGVGDYTRALANELSSEPGIVSAVSLSDRYVDEVTTEPQGSLNVLRLPFRTKLRDPSVQTLVQAWIDQQSPDWLSLQFVCWSHAPHGVVWQLGPALRELGGERPWHVMCHELWVSRQHGKKAALIGLGQKRSIRRMLTSLAPAVVHTSLDVFRRDLQQIGQRSEKLALFGSIPITSDRASRPSPSGRLIFFGSPPRGEERREILEQLSSHMANHAIEISVIGGRDSDRRGFITELESALGPKVPIRDAGFLNADSVSEEFSRHDVGVSRMAGELTGKSSSVLAMLEHGLAIWAPMWREGDVDVAFRSERITRSLMAAVGMPAEGPTSFRPEVAQSFRAALSNPVDQLRSR